MNSRYFCTGILLLVFSGCESKTINSAEENSSSSSSLPTMTNTLGMKFSRIPAGEFEMGLKSYTTMHRETQGENPAHRVVISKPFWMGCHEATVGQFRQFVEETDYWTEAEQYERGSNTLNLDTGNVERKRNIKWDAPGFEQTDAHPVTCVTWKDAQEFCKWLSKKEGVVYRLPTEAEWEYACRAGTETMWSTGRTDASLEGFANLGDAALKQVFPQAPATVSWDDRHPFTAPVGMYSPNAFGLHDMHGNVGEWCADWYERFYYQTSPERDPTGPAEPQQWRVVRGGSWYNSPFSLRSSGRHDGVETAASITNGFRIVREVSTNKE